MQRYRERSKAKPQEKTRKQIAQQRLAWREKKRDQMRKLTEKQKNEILRKRREKYAQQRLNKGMVTKQGVMSGRVQILPKSPHKFLQHVQNILQTASPQKMKLLKEDGLFARMQQTAVHIKRKWSKK